MNAAPMRVFVAGSDIQIAGEISDAISDAYDILEADGLDPQTAASMAVTAQKVGKDPVEFAQHLVKLRRAARNAH